MWIFLYEMLRQLRGIWMSCGQMLVRVLPGIILCIGMAVLLHPQTVRAVNVQAVDSARVLAIQLEDEAITPVAARYIERGIREAVEMNAAAIVLELDTPGGLMQATQTIVRDIIGSPIPIIVYVTPSGARAASAGVFITLSGHVAAMAPATHIGAAHPVSLGGSAPSPPADTTDNGQERSSGVMEEKVVKDAAAWARSLAELRGRNADWAVRSVSESESITSTEALEQNVVDLVAVDMQELLSEVDGRPVVVSGDTLRLNTTPASIERMEMWWGERLLGVLSNPNVAFILMMVGFYGILFELYSGGWGLGGTVGAISLILAFFGLAVLPVNYAGLALIGLGLGLFLAEVFVPSFGALSLGGVVCLVLGGLMLVDSPVEFMQVSVWVVVPIALATAAIAFFLAGSVVKAARTRVQTGGESMMGARAVADETFARTNDEYTGLVHTHGELWRAISRHPVEEGDMLEVTDRQGLTLYVVSDRPDDDVGRSDGDAH